MYVVCAQCGQCGGGKNKNKNVFIPGIEVNGLSCIIRASGGDGCR